MTEDAVSEPWEPLSVVDFSILGLIGTLQAFALLICAHLLKWRKWPPYVTKSPILVVIATVSGVLWTVAMAIAAGFLEREEGDILAACDFERFLSWSTLCVHTVAFFIRVYRMWRILIKHDSNMWHTEHQVMFMSSVSLIPVMTTWIAPHSGHFDEIANTCATSTMSAAVVLFMDLLGFLAICFLWFVCARQLRSVRKQFNEYDTMKYTLLCMTITLTSYAVVVVILLADDLVLQRRVAIFYPLLTTYILLWGSIREPFLMKMLGDDEYLWSYTKGFAELPSPAQLKASLAEQLSVDQLRDEFRRYIKTKVAQELVDFYLDSLDREEVMGFFERQAVTMRIVEQYIREGAPDQVNISEECREKILATDVTAFNIFDEARTEVLTVMETNFRRDFVTTEGFQRILDASEEEQRELRMLRAGGMLPAGSPSTPSPAGKMNIAPSSPVPAGNRPPPESPPFVEGLKDAFKKLPFLVSNAKAASEARRRRRGGKGGARVGGSARVSADSIGASGSGDRREGDTAIDADLALALRLQEDENAIGREVPRVARSEVGGAPRAAAAAAAAVATGGVEPGERGAKATTPKVYAVAWTGGSGTGGRVTGGDRRVISDAAAASPPRGKGIGDRARVPDYCRGKEDNSDGRGGEQYVRVAVPHQPSSLEFSLSASASGSNDKGEMSDNPSSDSLLGIYFSSWSDRHLHRSCSGEGGDGPEQRPFASTPGVEASAGGEGGGGGAGGKRDTTSEGTRGKSSTAEAASRTDMSHSPADRMYQGVTGVGGSGRGFTRLGDTEEGSSSSGGGGSSSSPAGLARLGPAAFATPGLKHGATSAAASAGGSLPACTDRGTVATDAWFVRADAEYVPERKRRMSGGEGPPGLTVFAHGDCDDRIPREDGVEGLEGLSPVLTEDSPDWVRFSEWIEREEGTAVRGGDGTISRGGAGGGGVSARRGMVDAEASFSPDGAGSGGSCVSGGEHTGESWCSGSSTWSNIHNPFNGSDNARGWHQG